MTVFKLNICFPPKSTPGLRRWLSRYSAYCAISRTRVQASGESVQSCGRPSNPMKKAGAVVHICNFGSGGTEAGGSLDHTSCLAKLMNFRFMTPLFQKIRWSVVGDPWGWHLAFTYMSTHGCTAPCIKPRVHTPTQTYATHIYTDVIANLLPF